MSRLEVRRILMEADVDAELLKTCWVPLGFKLAGRHCAVKFHTKAGQLHTMLTDYESIYYEIANFMEKFSSLNAKLGGPEKTLLEKVRYIFMSPTTKVSNQSKNDNTLEFNLEVIAGKRAIKWRFIGQHLDSMNYVFSHITRPLLNILSVVADECDLRSVKAPLSCNSFSGLFGKPSVQKLYETVTMESGDSGNDSINSGTDGKNNTDKSDTDPLPATPSPVSVHEGMNKTNRDQELSGIRTVRESPKKKPRLKY